MLLPALRVDKQATFTVLKRWPWVSRHSGPVATRQAPSGPRCTTSKQGERMARIAAEALVERLVDWGVDTIFGLPGDGIDGIMEGLRRHQDKIKFVLVHHEEAAAFMATAHAKATGKLGVCLATS